jgi:hypothetical protein
MRLAALLALVLLVPLGAEAQTQSPDEQLAAVRELVLHATYREALTQAQAFLTRTDLDAAQRNAGLEVLAIVQLVLHDGGAAATLGQLYGRDPGHRLDDPDASPIVQSAFARARESARGTPVTVEDATDAAPATRVVPTVAVSVGAAAGTVQELRVHYRLAGDSRYLNIVLATEPDGSATTPLAVTPPPGAYSVEYYVEALAPSSTVLGRLGSAEAPRQLAIPAPSASDTRIVEGPSGTGGPAPVTGGGGIETEAWFWVVLGVLVVGGGVGAGVGIALSSGGAQDGSLGTVQLPLASF